MEINWGKHNIVMIVGNVSDSDVLLCCLGICWKNIRWLSLFDIEISLKIRNPFKIHFINRYIFKNVRNKNKLL